MSLSDVVEHAARGRPPDPRWYQIGALSGLLLYGLTSLDFDVTLARVALLLAAAISTQFVCTRIWRLPSFDPKSALISGLSLCLLLRTNSASLAVLAAAAAVSSKFLLRVGGKHLFNPTNFGIVAVLLATGRVWVSPAQWGNAAFLGFLLAGIGGFVVHRSTRSDVTLAFLGLYLALVFARSAWLGEPLAIPLHRLQSGALLIFAFFMISDPKTTPNSRAGRILFGLLVAAGAAFIQFRLFRTNGPLWSLAAFSLAVPGIDRLLPGCRYVWAGSPEPPSPLSKGASDETPLPDSRFWPLAARREPPRAPVLRVLRGPGGRETL
ncbi:MAG TPA: RnfABCDGE type electron transport complex subunit D [Thermoanaerobaculia bacterium]|nr:RnfABCDGE type electron transport complex subunit D [Thermoanaerobaculia bacterium]